MKRSRANMPWLESSRRRRGAIFITALILLVGMAVVILSLASEVSLDHRMGSNLAESDQAMEIAKVGIDSVIYMAKQNSNWRQAYGSGVWISNCAMGGGTLTVSVSDPDGNISDSPIDPVVVRSTGTYNGAVSTLSATLLPPVHDSMKYLAFTRSTGDSALISFVNGPRVYGCLYTESRTSYTGALPDLRGDIYTPVPINTPAALADADTRVILLTPPLSSPPADLQWFVNRGSIMLPPLVGGIYQVSNKVISPTSNPHGFANSEGIYVIHNAGTAVKFTNCHITGTIVVTGTAAVTFDQACVHAPATPRYPAILCATKIYYQFTQNLSESVSDVDFNGDGDKLDVFVPSVSGVVYAGQFIYLLQYTLGTNVCRFKGALVARSVYFYGPNALFEQDPELLTNLVCQFHGPGLRLVRGSLRVE